MTERIFSDEEKAVMSSRFYPKYHLAAPIGWINDPNGFCYFKDRYHMFYQYHPYSPDWGPMHWGHAASKDLVHWEHEPIAIAPDRDYDNGGCFSGSAIEKDGKLYLMYTGHVPNGDYHHEKQCLAVSKDGIHFEKFSGNPILDAPRADDIVYDDFRDPKIWRHGRKYYCIIGSKTPDEHGQVLLFKFVDLKGWELKRVTFRDNTDRRTMYECPNLAEFDDGAVMILSVIVFQDGFNEYLPQYSAGKMNYRSGKFTGGELKMLDYGSSFYAPQIMTAPDGRVIMMGWLNMWNVEMPEHDDGWAGLMTIPREIIFEGDRVRTVPVKEMETLRGECATHLNLSLAEETELDGVEGDVGELLVEVDLKNNPIFSINLRAGEDEKTALTYNAVEGKLILDRTQSGLGPKDVREAVLQKSDKLSLRIFLDKSSVEIFANDGEAVFTSRIYPKETSQKILFVPQKYSLVIDSVKFYKFK